MQLPEKIKIGGFEIKVITEENLVLTRNHLGEYRPDNQMIVIDENVSDQQAGETLLHELIEAINHIYGFELQHRDISLLAVVLFQVLKDNDINIK